MFCFSATPGLFHAFLVERCSSFMEKSKQISTVVHAHGHLVVLLYFPREDFVAAQSLNCVRLFATLWTLACQTPLSLEFSRKNARMGCPFLLQGTFPTQGFNPHLLHCRWILYCWGTREAHREDWSGPFLPAAAWWALSCLCLSAVLWALAPVDGPDSHVYVWGAVSGWLVLCHVD